MQAAFSATDTCTGSVSARSYCAQSPLATTYVDPLSPLQPHATVSPLPGATLLSASQSPQHLGAVFYHLRPLAASSPHCLAVPAATTFAFSLTFRHPWFSHFSLTPLPAFAAPCFPLTSHPALYQPNHPVSLNSNGSCMGPVHYRLKLGLESGLRIINLDKMWEIEFEVSPPPLLSLNKVFC